MSVDEVCLRFRAAVEAIVEGEFVSAAREGLRWQSVHGALISIELTDGQWRDYWERCASVEDGPAELMALHFYEQIQFLEPEYEEAVLIAPRGGFCWEHISRAAREEMGEGRRGDFRWVW
ncbi:MULTISPECIES: hypothetical protein [unclassified Corynebacterium]|uniref:hypothetical protein n=1 Tax=unclassified Corynebacterium TaxID=2624378 RepID=UPI0029C9D69E|nr:MULTISPECIES: hypothetical protein [unclassified Corynebacterium]WPF66460.1 hypothetical protein OLX12_01670 [Corynebacterium sp. 22KM0430]WPF68950.1 hypothetical protein OLW90_01670 [Corynebacterium sp. 21KM1197]